MKIKIEVPFGIGTISDWNEDELLVNGKSSTEFFKKIGKMIKDKGIEKPIVNLTIVLYVADAEKMNIEEIEE